MTVEEADDDGAAAADGGDDDRAVEGDMDGSREAGCNDAERCWRGYHFQVNIGVVVPVEVSYRGVEGRRWPVENGLARYHHSYGRVYPSWSSCPYSGWGQPGRPPLVHELTADRCCNRRYYRADIDTIYDPYILLLHRRRRPNLQNHRGEDDGGIGEKR